MKIAPVHRIFSCLKSGMSNLRDAALCPGARKRAKSTRRAQFLLCIQLDGVVREAGVFCRTIEMTEWNGLIGHDRSRITSTNRTLGGAARRIQAAGAGVFAGRRTRAASAAGASGAADG